MELLIENTTTTTPELFNLLEEFGVEHIFRKGEYLSDHSSYIDNTVFLFSGISALCKKREELKNPKIIRFVQPQEILNSESVFNQKNNKLDWFCITDVKAFFLSNDSIRKHLSNSPKLQFELFQLATKNLKKLDQSAANRLTLSLKHQFFLLFDEMTEITELSKLSVTPISRTLLGNYFGCSKSSLSRIFAYYKKKGVIKEQNKGFVIDEFQLKQFRLNAEMPD